MKLCGEIACISIKFIYISTITHVTFRSFSHTNASIEMKHYVTLHPPHRHPAKFGYALLYFPLYVWQEIVFQAKQTCKQQTNTLTETKLL